MKLKVGEKAPEFILPDQNGKMHALKDYLDKWVLVYFYPKDDTPGCTTEACSVRDNLPHFSKHELEVLGISVDSAQSHKKFADKYKLPFTLLSDNEKKVVNQYDVWHEKSFMGKKYLGTLRTSFLVNPKGEIAKIYENVKPAEHVQQVLTDLQQLQR